ncbi:hypothetical protein KC640_01295 [Candidatus Dojkabacteria bacterium]|uniref:Uncharacterized protein n=1 Tax=Candidatus Dojkabacteria bacterium TaxID=2099670 RepID=A0A955L0C1_9BACT|nr:hypothetical protein [Candidatus Dojkabacteria bacterium]
MNAFTIIVLVILVVMIVVFMLRSKLLLALHFLIKVLFPTFAVFVLIALFIPGVYETAADWSLRQIGTYDSLVGFDQQIDTLVSAPQNIWNGIQDLFGAPSQVGESAQPLETQVYPGLVSGLAFIYRILCLSFSIIGMGVLVYLSYSTASQTEVEQLKLRVRSLEHKLNDTKKNP